MGCLHSTKISPSNAD